MDREPDFLLDSYLFDLPQDLVAQSPAEPRDCSRLMVVDKGQGVAELGQFSDLGRFLPPGALLVANNTKVLPARLTTTKPTGGAVELLLLTPLPLITPQERGDWREARVEALVRAKKVRPGDKIRFADDLEAEIISRGEFGRSQVLLRWQGDLAGIFERLGHVPLPPYIQRPDQPQDRARYQTVYADPAKQGSAAAPTAGLHFTPDLRQALAQAGFGWAEVTLHVGYGTFSPVRVADIREHRMHAEYFEIPGETAEKILEAKAQGRKVIAVGTTSARTLEGAFALSGAVKAQAGWTEVFITPGHRFQVVDGMVTNFHLPASSLVIMISALAGRKVILDAYAQAVRQGFRFFSYGDAMLIR